MASESNDPSLGSASGSNSHMRQAHTQRQEASSNPVERFFNVPLASNRYQAQRIIGRGAYGIVCRAMDTRNGKLVAVKRITKCLDSGPMATRVLRELKFLRLLSTHENIVNIRDIMLPGDRDSFNDTFAVFELMDADLSRILNTKEPLAENYIRYFMFQILRGVHYMHGCRVIHRDLKPNNILVNKSCDIRITDFGLARASFEETPDTLLWTDYVATRYYRAPELIIQNSGTYSTAIDMWSIGCIFAELLSNGKVLFPGRSSQNQLELIIKAVGPVSGEDIMSIQDIRARTLFSRVNRRYREQKGESLKERFSSQNPMAVDLLTRLLTFNPNHRMSALEALRQPYFASYHHLGLGEEPKPVSVAEFRFEKGGLPPEYYRDAFLKEILYYHPEEEANALKSWSESPGYRKVSAVTQFGLQMDSLQNRHGTRLASQTLEEKVLEEVGPQRGASSDRKIAQRQHVTMSESEIARIVRK